tara:strand:+ start:1272 stop:1577 length:306 start_codon:yes stop_codon:yes gene_type:complete
VPRVKNRTSQAILVKWLKLPQLHEPNILITTIAISTGTTTAALPFSPPWHIKIGGDDRISYLRKRESNPRDIQTLPIFSLRNLQPLSFWLAESFLTGYTSI